MSDYSFLVPEMAHDVIENKPFFWVTRTLDIICALLVLFIGIYHLYALYQHSSAHNLKKEVSQQSSTTTGQQPSGRRTSAMSMTPTTSSRRTSQQRSRSRANTHDSKKIGRWAKALHILTILFIFCSFVVILILLLNIWSVFPLSFSCDNIVYVLCISFHLSKSIFYAILITRLQVAFGASAYGYSNFAIYSLFIAITIYSSIIIAGTPFVIYGKWVTEPYNWCHVHIFDDHGIFVPIGVLSWIIMDVLISLILLFLFQKPIRSLLSLLNKNRKLANLMVKYTILTWISIILSLFSLLLYLWKHITTLIEINLPFTCFCVILMHVKYDNLFNSLCKICTVCCYKVCGSHKYRANSVKKIKYDQTKITIDGGDNDDDQTRKASTTASCQNNNSNQNGGYNNNHLSPVNIPPSEHLHVPQDSDGEHLHVTQDSDGTNIELVTNPSFSNNNENNKYDSADSPTPVTHDNDQFPDT